MKRERERERERSRRFLRDLKIKRLRRQRNIEKVKQINRDTRIPRGTERAGDLNTKRQKDLMNKKLRD